MISLGTERGVSFSTQEQKTPRLSARLRAEGVEVMEACTLVLLSTDQF